MNLVGREEYKRGYVDMGRASEINICMRNSPFINSLVFFSKLFTDYSHPFTILFLIEIAFFRHLW